ncbi:sulfotransferase family protein [Mameliella alba]|uniref:sulfotransferase family protein n=1 Tax=Mameliella alba TaxID=561184 RepID=UPI000B533546|nr:sulfotransferase family protein [Mameliella alba]OWV39215.1 hypothetical protein CDZ95_27245 [Mameliella alba]
MKRDQKIFCIGLPKTGTTSLHFAALQLGLRSVHWPRDTKTVTELRNGVFKLSLMETCDIVSDIPIPAIFRELDAVFPGSKFVLTTRDKDGWLRSQGTAGFNARTAAEDSDRAFYRQMLYGVNEFDEQRFAEVYDSHHTSVQEYFDGDRAADLLTMDISRGGAGWNQLCAFLGLPVPDMPFPHSNIAGEDKPAPRPTGLLGKARRAASRLMGARPGGRAR